MIPDSQQGLKKNLPRTPEINTSNSYACERPMTDPTPQNTLNSGCFV
jgi:hypothetical protein